MTSKTRDQPPILALHGLGGGAYFFRGLAERLRPDYRVVAIDLPHFSGRLHADLGRRARHARGRRASGSQSSSSATRWAPSSRSRPGRRGRERIRGLIFVGGVPQVAPHIRERLSERVRALEGARDLIGWGQRVSPGVFSAATFRDRPEVVAAFERMFETQTVESLRALLPDPARGKRRAARADRDRSLRRDHRGTRPVRAAGSRRQRSSSGCRANRTWRSFPTAGHLPFLEQPDAFAAAVKAFLRTC